MYPDIIQRQLSEKALEEPETVEEPKETPESPVKTEPLRITLEPDRFQEYKTRMNNLSKYMVLGHIAGRTPGARKLTIWASSSLHRSFRQLTIRSNNYFEILSRRGTDPHVGGTKIQAG